ncbi:MAG: peroxiredoxin [Chitinophagales bacterium]|jgi:alkyl hydroperoxide reductase subunit AhpC|nr:peroxiredoxin [Saprospirales bacterium]MBK8350370.1 peroxiredoxin [Saprospirales bacterium]MBP6660295.1 peroxiredoxin [Chitinophagales bacterium]
MALLSVGQKFPSFDKKSVVSVEKGKEFQNLTNDVHQKDGKWMVIYFWPKDFTFVCPTEIIEFDSANGDFKDRDAVLIGASTDSEFVHLGWRTAHEGLNKINHPMLADTSKSLSRELGILTEGEEVCYRATFIVDPQGIIRFVSVNDLSVGRNVKEVIRVLDALQTDELCPCNWQKGEATLS